MSGEHDLNEFFRKMNATLADGVFVYATLPDHDIPEGLKTQMVFEEQEGTTLILHRTEAEAYGLPFTFPCRMITLSVHSALDAVGFISRVCTALAKENMGVNPVAGFYHDHLFVPDGRQEDALRVLHRLTRNALQRA